MVDETLKKTGHAERDKNHLQTEINMTRLFSLPLLGSLVRRVKTKKPRKLKSPKSGRSLGPSLAGRKSSDVRGKQAAVWGICMLGQHLHVCFALQGGAAHHL